MQSLAGVDLIALNVKNIDTLRAARWRFLSAYRNLYSYPQGMPDAKAIQDNILEIDYFNWPRKLKVIHEQLNQIATLHITAVTNHSYQKLIYMLMIESVQYIDLLDFLHAQQNPKLTAFQASVATLLQNVIHKLQTLPELQQNRRLLTWAYGWYYNNRKVNFSAGVPDILKP